MRLLIIGHTAHYQRNRRIVGWGPTVKEVDWLAKAYDQVTHLACFIPGPAPASSLAYQNNLIRFVFVPPAGGLNLSKKLKVIPAIPVYIKAILKSISEADVILVRSPSPLAMVAMILVGLRAKQLRWVKYAGNWGETGITPLSFAFQRWWLKAGLSRGPVTINGNWPEQGAHLYSFDNPSFSLAEIEAARQVAWNKQLTIPIRFAFVGNVEAVKGMGTALKVIQGLHQQGIEIRFDILGDGPQRSDYEQMSRALGVEQFTQFHGWVTHDQVKTCLDGSHFLLLPSVTEGWPKVLSEAMAFGVVPLSSRVSAIPQIMGETQAGFAFPSLDVNTFVEKIIELIQSPEQWKTMSLAGINAAPRFTYERYLMALDEMFEQYYGASPMNQTVLSTIRERFETFEQGRKVILEP